MDTLENTAYHDYCIVAAEQLCKAIANGEDASKTLDKLCNDHHIERHHIKECFLNLVRGK